MGNLFFELHEGGYVQVTDPVPPDEIKRRITKTELKIIAAKMAGEVRDLQEFLGQDQSFIIIRDNNKRLLAKVRQLRRMLPLLKHAASQKMLS